MKLSNLKSDSTLILGYLNPALNTPAQYTKKFMVELMYMPTVMTLISRKDRDRDFFCIVGSRSINNSLFYSSDSVSISEENLSGER